MFRNTSYSSFFVFRIITGHWEVTLIIVTEILYFYIQKICKSSDSSYKFDTTLPINVSIATFQKSRLKSSFFYWASNLAFLPQSNWLIDESFYLPLILRWIRCILCLVFFLSAVTHSWIFVDCWVLIHCQSRIWQLISNIREILLTKEFEFIL